MDKLRVLYISNGHPDLYLGGAEVYAYELFKAMRESEDFEPILLARSTSTAHRHRQGTCFHSVNGDPNQILWSQDDHDYFFLTSPDKSQFTVHFHQLLTAYRPHLVHIQHTVGLGVDLIRQIKNSLPGTPVVYTLHEYLPICNAQGHMLRTRDGSLCQEASPIRCHDCFLEVPPQRFFLRERFIKSQFRHVDLFLCPSRFLLDRHREWGIPSAKLRVQEYGRAVQVPVPADRPSPGNIGFFGQLMPHKGLIVLLQAMKLLQQEGNRDIHLYLNGANLERQSDDFRAEVEGLLRECDNVTFRGMYAPSELPERMRDIAWVVIPSIWWENSPLVIQEAFMHQRPVVCSDVGGMAEKVRDGIDGLHFRVGEPADLAATLRRAAASPDLWQRLRSGIRSVYSISAAVEDHASIYRSLMERAT